MKGIISKIMSVLLISVLLSQVIPVSYVNATVTTSSVQTEEELKSIISKYRKENIVFENAASINVGQEVESKVFLRELGENAVINSNNENLLKIVEGKIIGVKEGTTFLIVEKEGKYHVKEVYVADTKSAVSTFSVNNAATNLRPYYVVYVDVGHGGTDPGAVANGVNEKDLNLKIGLKVRDKLEYLGVQVIMNRETDVYVDYKDVATHANSVKPDVFVSIHNNASTASSTNGIESFYSKAIDKPFGTEIHNRLISNTKAYNRGLKEDTYYVTNHTTMPAVLVEGGFLTNKTEVEKLKKDSYQEAIANAIVDGAVKYLESNVKISAIPAERIAGENRYATSLEIFNKGWTSSETAILVTGEKFPDAICATPLAQKYNAPIILSREESLKNQNDLKTTLVNKGVKNVIIIGSEETLPSVIESDLQELGIDSRRIAGIGRYETAVEIAKEIGVSTGEVVVAYGENFPDALSIASIAAKKQIPILLTKSNELSDATNNFVKQFNIKKTYVLGSEKTITNNVAKQLVNVERLGGVDRYNTNEIVFNRFKSELNLTEAYIASALNFPDATTVSALASSTNSFIILSHPKEVTQPTKNIINSMKQSLTKVYVIGDSTLIADNTFIGTGIGLIK